MPNETIPDQADVLALNVKLTADLSAARAELASHVQLAAECESLKTDMAALQSEKARLEALVEATRDSDAIVSARAEIESLKASVTALTGERDAIKADNAKLKTDMSDFNKRVACEIAKHGISTIAFPMAQTLRRPSLDEEVAAAKCQPAK